jgi:hypothetical protein
MHNNPYQIGDKKIVKTKEQFDKFKRLLQHVETKEDKEALGVFFQDQQGNKDAAGQSRAVQRLLQLAESSSGSPQVQADFLEALYLIVTDHQGNQDTAAGVDAIKRLLQLAAFSSGTPAVQQQALNVFGRIVFPNERYKDRAADEGALELLLQLAESSCDAPEVQQKALKALARILWPRYRNQSLVTPEMFSRVFQLSLSIDDFETAQTLFSGHFPNQQMLCSHVRALQQQSLDQVIQARSRNLPRGSERVYQVIKV